MYSFNENILNLNQIIEHFTKFKVIHYLTFFKVYQFCFFLVQNNHIVSENNKSHSNE